MLDNWEDWNKFNNGYVENYNKDFPAIVDTDITELCKKYSVFMNCPATVYKGKALEAKSRKGMTKKSVIKFITDNDNIIPYTAYVYPVGADGKFEYVYVFRYVDMP